MTHCSNPLYALSHLILLSNPMRQVPYYLHLTYMEPKAGKLNFLRVHSGTDVTQT
jgi:hypothetical protein